MDVISLFTGRGRFTSRGLFTSRGRCASTVARASTPSPRKIAPSRALALWLAAGLLALTALPAQAQQPVMTVSKAFVEEGDDGDSNPTLDFVVRLNPAPTGAASVRYQTTMDVFSLSGSRTVRTATAGADYTRINATTLNFASGETRKTVQVTITNDSADEGDEVVALRFTSPSGISSSGFSGGALVQYGVIGDRDDFDSSASEQSSCAGVNLARAGQEWYNTTDTSQINPPQLVAFGGDDVYVRYELRNKACVPVGGISFTVDLGLANATTFAENVAVMQVGENALVRNSCRFDYEVIDDDFRRQTSMNGEPDTDDGVAKDTLRFSHGFVDGDVRNNNAEGSEGVACEVVVRMTVPGDITTNDYIAWQPTGTRAGVGGDTAFGTPRSATFVSVTLNAGRARASVSAVHERLAEGSDAEFIFRLSKAPEAAVTVAYATQGGNAVAGTDYVASQGMLTFSTTETVKTVSVQTLDNGRVDAGASFQMAITSVSANSAILSGRGSASVTITNINPASATLADARGAEGQNVAFIVSLSDPLPSPTSVEFTTADGSATGGAQCEAGVDYVAASARVVNFAANQLSATVLVAACLDEVDDPNETFTAELTRPVGMLELGDRTTATGTIVEGLSAEQVQALNQAILPHVAASIGEETNIGIHARVRDGFDSQATGTRLPAPLQALAESPAGALAALAQKGSRFGLDDLDFALQMQAADDGKPLAGGSGFGLWGRGYFRDLSVDSEGMRFDGDITGVMLGGDTRVSNLLLGMGFNHTIAEMDWQLDTFKGSHETTLNSFHPYIGWQNSHGVVVWGSLGFGMGEAEITDSERADFRYTRDLAVRTATFGAHGPVWTRGSLSLGIMGDASETRLEESGFGSDDEVVQTSVSSRWLRAGLTLDYDLAQGGAGLALDAELALRRDLNDAKSGRGLELGGGLDYSTPGGLRLNLDARYLVTHDADVDEFGVSGSLAYSRNTGGQGLTLSFRPEYGVVTSAKEALWKGAYAAPRAREPFALSYAFEVKYGIPVLQGRELLTVFARTGLHSTANRHALGADFNLGQHFSTGLEAALRPGAAEPSDHHAYLRYQRAF